MYAWCQDMPGVSADDYAQTMAQIAGAEENAPGLVAHVAGPVEGGFRIVQVWKSKDDADRFLREQVGPAVARAHGHRAQTVRAGFRVLDVTG